MTSTLKNDENDRVMLGLLQSVERNGEQSQRRLAAELGVALGLVNAYLKRCVKKGLVKVSEAPTRRYAYYLTAQGFAEKSRLTVDYIAHSFSFFRSARADCEAVFAIAENRGWARVVLAGKSDLAEIARICAIDSKVKVVGIVDNQANISNFIGLPIFASFDSVPPDCDGVVVTDLRNASEVLVLAVAQFGVDRVVAPKLLGLGPSENGGLSQ